MQLPAVEQEYWRHVKRTIASCPTYDELGMIWDFWGEVFIPYETFIIWVDEGAYDREKNEYVHASLSNYGGYSYEVKRGEEEVYIFTPSNNQTFGDVVASHVKEKMEEINDKEFVAGIEGWFKTVYAGEWCSTKGETMSVSDFEETLKLRLSMESWRISSDSSMMSELLERKAAEDM